MTTVPDEPGVSVPALPVPSRRRPRWWLELPLAVAYYYAYARIRDLHGDATVHSRSLARAHGLAIYHAERFLGLDIEHGAQHLALHARYLIVAMDVYYGTLHFLLTLGVFVWLLFRGAPERFRHGRNVLAIATGLALVVFALYPTMPPRLMPAGIKTIDTSSTIGGLWSYNNGSIEHIADPFAAMPSLHIVWASWVAYVLWRGRPDGSRWRKLFWIYPVFTGVTIIAVGVHWVLDIAGALVVFGVGLVATRWSERWAQRRRERRRATGQEVAGPLSNASRSIDSETPESRLTAP